MHSLGSLLELCVTTSAQSNLIQIIYALYYSDLAVHSRDSPTQLKEYRCTRLLSSRVNKAGFIQVQITNLEVNNMGI